MPLPPAPVHSAITPSTQTAVTIVMAAFAAVTLVFSLVHWARTGKPTFLLLFLAGGCMMAMEPAVDTVGGCWFPRIHSWIVFTAYGRPIPLWLCLAYFFYFGIGVGVYWLIIRGGLTRAQLFVLFGAAMLGDFILETVLLHFHTYIYYGGQPLRVLHFPLWWAPVNAVIVVVSAGLNTAAGWPSWFAINATMPWAVRQLAGLATFALATWFVSLAAAIAPAPAGATEPRSRPARLRPRARRAAAV